MDCSFRFALWGIGVGKLRVLKCYKLGKCKCARQLPQWAVEPESEVELVLLRLIAIIC